MRSIKLFSVILTIVMLISTAPVYAAEEFVIADGVLKQYNGPGGDVVIPNGVTEIFSSAFFANDDITSVTIPESVTSIDSGAFQGCGNLADISIPDSVTHIGNAAFADTAYRRNRDNWEGDMLYIDNHLIEAYWGSGEMTVKEGTVSIAAHAFEISDPTSVTIPNGVTVIGEYAFSTCTNLKNVTIPETVTVIGEGAFFQCIRLESITIPDGVTEICWGAFQDCTSLTSITLPDGVTDIGVSAFSGCTKLESITVPAAVTDIDVYAFENCPNLTIYCYADSPAEAHAIEKNIPYVLLSPPGDVSGDGRVNLSDVTLILKSFSYTDVTVDLQYADVNNDGEIDFSDVTLILKYIAKWDGIVLV